MNGWLGQLVTVAAKPFSFFVVIAPWEAALRIRMGRRSKVLTPGLHPKIPYLDRIYRQHLRLRTISESGVTAQTRDGKTMVMTISIEFSIVDLEAVYSSLASPEETLLARVAGDLVSYCETWDCRNVDSNGLKSAAGNSEDAAAEWGLGDFKVIISSLATMRAYRIVANDFRDTSGFDTECFDAD